MELQINFYNYFRTKFNPLKKILTTILFLFIYCITLSVQAQSWQWIHTSSAGNSNIDKGTAIVTDGAGHYYAVGEYWSTIDFTLPKLTAKGGPDGYIMKMDATGNIKWATSTSGGTVHIRSICRGRSGNLFVSGYYTGGGVFGSHRIVGGGTDEGFVAKLDSNGKWIWINRVNSGNGDDNQLYAIAIDNNENLYVTGGFEGHAFVGSSEELYGTNHFSAFAAKMDSAGKWLWTMQAGGIDNTRGYSIAVDKSGEAYITGGFRGPMYVAGDTLKSNNSCFILKLSANGSPKWAKELVNVTGNIYYVSSGLSTVCDTSGAYIGGSYAGLTAIGTDTLKGSSEKDFVAKISKDGKWQWAKTNDRTNHDSKISALSLDNSGNINVGGFFYDSLSFGSTILGSKYKNNGFIAHISFRIMVMGTKSRGE